MARPTALDEIRQLDPVQDHQRIVYLSKCYDFPFDTTRALEFALFRTFCVPSISALLDRTGEFQRRAQRRYDDTDIIVSEITEWGYDSSRGRQALRRMNQIHGRFTIANEDFLYVLSTFIFEPIRWNARFGWRFLCQQEKLAMFYFWREIGLRMGIQDIPAEFEAYEQLNLAYERERFCFSPSNQRVGEATREMFAGWFARPLRPLVRATLYALMDEPLVRAFGFPNSPRWMRAAVTGALRLRALLLRVLPRRRRPSLRTNSRPRSYPNGYQIDQIGPPLPTGGVTLPPGENGEGS